MRILVILLLFGLGLWQAVVDWQATIGQGYAYRLTSVGQVWANAGPGGYEGVVGILRESSIPYLWEPVGATLLALPMALVLIGLAGLIWITRKRGR